MKDIQVFTALDAKTVAAEKLDILLLSTEGAADMATYNDLEKLKAAFQGKKVAAMADKMFNQDNTLADTLIRKCVWLASKILRMWAALHPALKLHSAKICRPKRWKPAPPTMPKSRQGCGGDHDRRGSAGGLHRAGEAVRRNVL